MANEDEKELESILKETEAPSRANGKDKPKTRIAKLTGRTYSSLKAKIKEKRLTRAFDKYNEAYKNMRKALVEANKTRAAQAKDDSITNSEVAADYEIVASYSKKLAKHGAKLLEDDIARLVADKKAKPIRAPRFLVGKMRTLVKAIAKKRDNSKTKKLQKGLADDITKTTQEYIQSSLEGAIFKNSQTGELKKEIDKKVIKDLKLDNSAETFEDKIANLRKFISKDGQTPMFGEEELAKPEKASTDVPPVEPTPTVEKEEVELSEEQLLGNLGSKKTPVADEEDLGKKTEPEAPQVQSRVTMDDLMKGLGVAKTPVMPISEPVKKAEEEPKEKPADKADEKNPKDETPVKLSSDDKNTVSARKREVSAIVSLGKNIESLEKQYAKVNDPETKSMIEGYIEGLKAELENIVERSTIKKVDKERIEEPVKEETVHTHEEVTSMEPIVVQPKEETMVESHKDEKTTSFTLRDGRNVNVRVKESESMRAEQISTPAALRVTSSDVDKFVSRFEAATSRSKALEQEKEELVRQKEMLLRDIEQKTLAAERKADNMARENEELRGEVANLSQIGSSLGGRSR